MTTSRKIKNDIRQVVTSIMDVAMDNALANDPFLPLPENALFKALVPNEILKGSHFVRHFVVQFGQVWEKLARIASTPVFDKSLQRHSITGLVPIGRLRRIQEVLNKLERSEKCGNKIMPNWDSELKYVLRGRGGLLPTTVVSDIYVEKGNAKYAFELKAPLPNSDQTKVSKEKLLKLYSMVEKPVSDAFFALPYNPYGKREDYNWDFPARWFNMKADRVVLIGDEFWDIIGGAGTYQLFISEINKLGGEYKERIYREYLGIDNPNAQGFELR